MNLKKVTLVLAVIGILYIPLTCYYRYHHLTTVTGTLKEVVKTRTRIPYYEFYLNEYDNMFYNEGRGWLSIFKKDIQETEKPVSFSILTSDAPSLGAGEPILYIGFNQQNVWIDLLYSVKEPNIFIHLFQLMLYFIEAFLLVICIYIYKMRLFEILFIIYLIMITLFMGL